MLATDDELLVMVVPTAHPQEAVLQATTREVILKLTPHIGRSTRDVVTPDLRGAGPGPCRRIFQIQLPRGPFVLIDSLATRPSWTRPAGASRRRTLRVAGQR